MTNLIIEILKREYNQSDQRPFNIKHLFNQLTHTTYNTAQLNNLLDEGMDLVYPITGNTMNMFIPYNIFLLQCKLVPVDDSELVIPINCHHDALEILVNRGVNFKISEWNSPTPSISNHINVLYNYQYLTQLPNVPIDDYCWYIALAYWNLPFNGNTEEIENSKNQLVVKVHQYYTAIPLDYTHRRLINMLGGLDKVSYKRVESLMWRNPLNDTGRPHTRCPYTDLLIYSISKLRDGNSININLPSYYYGSRINRLAMFLLMDIKGMININDRKYGDSRLNKILNKPRLCMTKLAQCVQ